MPISKTVVRPTGVSCFSSVPGTMLPQILDFWIVTALDSDPRVLNTGTNPNNGYHGSASSCVFRDVTIQSEASFLAPWWPLQRHCKRLLLHTRTPWNRFLSNRRFFCTLGNHKRDQILLLSCDQAPRSPCSAARNTYSSCLVPLLAIRRQFSHYMYVPLAAQRPPVVHNASSPPSHSVPSWLPVALLSIRCSSHHFTLFLFSTYS